MPNSPHKHCIILFNKPFQVLCQFSEHEGKETLAKYLRIPHIYAAGRLDYDSEGLLVLTNNGALQSLITHPNNKLPKTYWAQLEGDIDEQALSTLIKGVPLKDGITLPAIAKKIATPNIWQRTPPIRERANIPTSWIELTIREGKNRQVRRMTSAVGFPTLRLIRKSIGPWDLTTALSGALLPSGKWQEGLLSDDLSKKLDYTIQRKSKKKPYRRHNKK